MGSTPIKPAINDVRNAPALIYQTDPGVWDYLFDGSRHDFDRFAAALWEAPETSYSHTEAHVMAGGSELAAIEVGYRGDCEPDLTARVDIVASEVLAADVLRPLIERARYIEYLTPRLPADCYYLHFLSIAPAFQGRGLGRNLLEHVFRRADRLDCSSVHLDVYTNNPAVSLYHAFGFELVVETSFPNKAGLPPHYRMVRTL